MVFDLQARRAVVRNTDVFVGVENLLDRQYVVNVSGPLQYIGLPRTIRGGVSLRSF
jgi:outer membrane receptor protein involved in Fe transport